jgi:hypothetical protein
MEFRSGMFPAFDSGSARYIHILSKGASVMKKLLLLLVAVLFSSSTVFAGDAGVDFDLHVSNRGPAPIIVPTPPLFLVPPDLGFEVAVGVNFDMFHIDGRFYQCREGYWYAAPRYDGPWEGVGPKHLPPGLAKKRYTEIIRLRDVEYVRYQKEKDHYHGKSYRPAKNQHGKGNGHGNGNGNGKKNKNK